MKNILVLTVLFTLSAGSAMADSGAFAPRYTLDNFKIATTSPLLGGAGEITEGSIEINSSTNELRLRLNRHVACPKGVFCIALMPAPIVVTLPIRHIENQPCGGVTITAEENSLPVDGSLTRVEVQDQNGSRCFDNADDITFVKRIKVTLTEMGARSRAESISVMSGFPSNR